MNSIGIMQGRLLPKYEGRYQAHPLGYWQEEFKIAEQLNLQCIEFIFDRNDYQKNPLFSRSGINEILKVCNDTGVGVRSVCADYLMEDPFHCLNSEIVSKSQEVISTLLQNLALLEVKDLVVPCVDHSKLDTEDDFHRFKINIVRIIELAESYGINISLETDLSPALFGQLLDYLPYHNVTVNYDTGNSASLGFDPLEEFAIYGNKISDIHIKDRKLNSGSVLLGTGDVKFDRFFKALKTINYTAPFIMQVYRDDEGVSVFKSQLEVFKSLIDKYYI
jgi:sugar phosphate isomerase/epimerase